MLYVRYSKCVVTETNWHNCIWMTWFCTRGYLILFINDVTMARTSGMHPLGLSLNALLHSSCINLLRIKSSIQGVTVTVDFNGLLSDPLNNFNQAIPSDCIKPIATFTCSRTLDSWSCLSASTEKRKNMC